MFTVGLSQKRKSTLSSHSVAFFSSTKITITSMATRASLPVSLLIPALRGLSSNQENRGFSGFLPTSAQRKIR